MANYKLVIAQYETGRPDLDADIAIALVRDDQKFFSYIPFSLEVLVDEEIPAQNSDDYLSTWSNKVKGILGKELGRESDVHTRYVKAPSEEHPEQFTLYYRSGAFNQEYQANLIPKLRQVALDALKEK